jgi:hypothetical protein
MSIKAWAITNWRGEWCIELDFGDNVVVLRLAALGKLAEVVCA